MIFNFILLFFPSIICFYFFFQWFSTTKMRSITPTRMNCNQSYSLRVYKLNFDKLYRQKTICARLLYAFAYYYCYFNCVTSFFSLYCQILICGNVYAHYQQLTCNVASWCAYLLISCLFIVMKLLLSMVTCFQMNHHVIFFSLSIYIQSIPCNGVVVFPLFIIQKWKFLIRLAAIWLWCNCLDTRKHTHTHIAQAIIRYIDFHWNRNPSAKSVMFLWTLFIRAPVRINALTWSHATLWTQKKA